MTKYAAKVDANQGEIVLALRRLGCTVMSIASVGRGCPDLVVGVRGKNVLLEVKDGRRPPSERKLTEAEREWIDAWRGQVNVVESVDDAIEVVFREVENDRGSETP